uniref:Tetratricopeptide repeat protein 33 n=1 Tax=Callorhinchus milii TaxID=7868 RepID=V9LC68_CALMI
MPGAGERLLAAALSSEAEAPGPADRKRRRRHSGEPEAEAQALRERGTRLSDTHRYSEAIRCWDEAIQLTPDCAALYEMKAQVLLMLDAVFRAVQVAEVAVRLAPRWWVALQTLGRAQLNMGEISLAIRSFQKALHVMPSERSLWDEDLRWALRLRDQQRLVAEPPPHGPPPQVPLPLFPDCDYDSEEMIAVCVGIAEREAARRGGAVIVSDTGSEQDPHLSHDTNLVRAR